MNRFSAIAGAFALAATVGLSASARVGEPAPNFSNVDTNGRTHTLGELKGKWVVLEWHNPGCEFTQKHYNSGNMPRLQKEWTAKGVVWLTVASPSVRADRAMSLVNAKGGAQTAVLLDADAATAKAYEAKTSPQMFVIDPKGVVVYNGAIDDKPTPNVEDVAGAKNYVAAALTEAMAGRPVTTPTSRPYGCAVSYPGATR
jgi:peroxiredoxin